MFPAIVLFFIFVMWSIVTMLKTPVEETKMSFSWRQSGNLPCTTAMRRRDDIPTRLASTRTKATAQLVPIRKSSDPLHV